MSTGRGRDSKAYAGWIKCPHCGEVHRHNKNCSASRELRSLGFYWVNSPDHGGWLTAKWDGEFWWLAGDNRNYRDSELSEIDPVVITREPVP